VIIDALLIPALVVSTGAKWSQELPTIDKVRDYRPQLVSRVYAGNGQLLSEYGKKKRIQVPFRLIPKPLYLAFVSAEDQRFFDHRGVDPISLARAARTNIITRFIGRRRLTGGSTITQQIAKNILLSNLRTVERKFKETILARQIEASVSKEQILEIYLNEIFLGQRAYGVVAAAQNYFGKRLNQLTLGQMAMLAGLPQAPTRYNPFRNPKLARARRNYVLRRMVTDGHITAAEAKAAEAKPLELKKRGQSVRPATTKTPAEYPLDEIRRFIAANFGDDTAKRGGFSIRATINPDLQRIAVGALRRGLATYDRRHGWRGRVAHLPNFYGPDWVLNWRRHLRRFPRIAGQGDWLKAVVLSTDVRNAYIGLEDGTTGVIPYREFSWARQQRQRARASGRKMLTAWGGPVRRASQIFQIGDLILVEKATKPKWGKKPYPEGTYTLRQIPIATGALVAMEPHTGRVLAMVGGFGHDISQFNAAAQAQRQPGSSFKPIVYLTALQNGFTPTTLVMDAPLVIKLENGQLYKPMNYNNKFYGPTTLRNGLVFSRNVMSVRLAARVGLGKVSEMATKLGIAKDLPEIYSMALGAYETTPVRMAAAYATMINGGKKVEPTLIDRIQDRTGKTIFRHTPFTCPGCGISQKERDARIPQLTDTRKQVVDPQSAFQIVSILKGVVQRSAYRGLLTQGYILAGKTGTTDDIVDTWFVGFSPKMVVAVWVGMGNSYSLGYYEAGARTAMPIFADFMKRTHKPPMKDFKRPDGLLAVRIGALWDKSTKKRRNLYEYYKVGVRPGSSPDGLGPGDGDMRFGDTAGDEY